MGKTNQTLNLLMNGLLVGTLTKQTAGGLSFRYDQQWLQQARARPISLSLPLVDQAYTGDVVYNFFDNLLPDNPQIRSRIQAKFQTPTAQPFDLLALSRKVASAKRRNADESYLQIAHRYH